MKEKIEHTHICFCGNKWSHSEDSMDVKQDHICCKCQSVVVQKYDTRFLSEEDWQKEMILCLSPAQVYQALTDYVLKLGKPLSQWSEDQ